MFPPKRLRSAALRGTLLALLAATPRANDCLEPVAVVPAGEASSGTNGAPELRGVGAPIVGGPFAVRVLGGREDGFGAVLVSPNESPVYVPTYEATLLLGLPFFVQQPFFLADDGDSQQLLSTSALPVELCGIEWITQAFLIDPGATGGIAFTNGLRVTAGVPSGSTFPNRAHATGGNEAALVAAGDLDLDGHLDAVVLHRVAGGAAVFRGTGHGDVASPTFLEIPGSPSDVALAALDGDAFPDLVVLLEDTAELLVFPGIGDGSFAAALTTSVGLEPSGVALGDLDGDGALDAVVANAGSDSASVWFGAGDGTFAAGAALATDRRPLDPELRDFDGNGTLDLVVAHRDDDSFGFHAGLGGGLFAAPISTALDVSPGAGLPSSLEAGDWDGDGHLDLAVGTAFSGVRKWIGDGAGGFAPVPEAEATWGVWNIAAGDLDGDGTDELVEGRFFLVKNEFWLEKQIAGEAPDEVELLLAGRFTSFELVDFDADGRVDILAADSHFDRLVVLQAVAPGAFAPLVPDDQGIPITYSAAFGDLDGDHLPDLLGWNPDADALFTALGDGLGSFDEPVLLEGVEYSQALRLAELTGDGLLDAALIRDEDFPVRDRLFVYPGLGDGTLATTPIITSLGPRPVNVYTGSFADVDADGTEDLIVSAALENEVVVFLNDGEGGFQQSSAHLGLKGEAAQVGDVTGDGLLDLVTQAPQAGSLLIAAGLGDGSFSETPSSVATLAKDAAWRLVDLDENGVLDIASYQLTGDVVVLEGLGGGSFAAPVTIGSPGTGNSLEIGDWNGDGALDLAALGHFFRQLLIMPGVGDGTFGPSESYAVETGTSFFRADFDGDGVDDLALGTSPLLSRVLD